MTTAISYFDNLLSRKMHKPAVVPKFRTLLHKQWAVFFNELHIPWEYLPVPGIADFWLPSLNVLAQVKLTRDESDGIVLENFSRNKDRAICLLIDEPNTEYCDGLIWCRCHTGNKMGYFNDWISFIVRSDGQVYLMAENGNGFNFFAGRDFSSPVMMISNIEAQNYKLDSKKLKSAVNKSKKVKPKE